MSESNLALIKLQHKVRELTGERKRIARETGIPYGRIRHFSDTGSLVNAADRRLLFRWMQLWESQQKRREYVLRRLQLNTEF